MEALSSTKLPQRTAPDGGWGWVIVFGTFMTSLICDGFAYTSGIFYEKFIEVYGESAAVTSLFESTMTGMTYLMGPVANGLVSAYGCRNVAICGSILCVVGMVSSVLLDSIYLHILTLGLTTGTGLGFIYLAQVVIVSFWFDENLALATGIAVCGSGIGISIFAVITESLLNYFGWKGAMLMLSAIMFTAVFYSSLSRKVSYIEENGSLKEALIEALNFTIFKDFVFSYLVFTQFLNGAVYYSPIIFLKDHLLKTGFGNERDAVRLLVYFGLSNAVGRALFGYIGDKQLLNRSILFAVTIIIYGTAIGMIAGFGQNSLILSISMIIYGAAQGAYVCLLSVIMVDIFGVKRLANALGISNMVLGFASLIGPPVIAKTVDPKTGYTNGFWISSALTILSGVLLLFLPLIRYKCKPGVNKIN